MTWAHDFHELGAISPPPPRYMSVWDRKCSESWIGIVTFFGMKGWTKHQELPRDPAMHLL